MNYLSPKICKKKEKSCLWITKQLWIIICDLPCMCAHVLVDINMLLQELLSAYSFFDFKMKVNVSL